VLVGSETPRLFTPPLRRLTRRTSKGYEASEFSEQVLRLKLLPWQRWLLIHGLELRPDGSYRFRTVVVLVSRQNGKTTVLKVVALWRMLLDNARLVLGTSTNLDYARESWEGAVELAQRSAETAPLFPAAAAGERRADAVDDRRRTVHAAANRRSGRSLSVDLGIADELREHTSWDAWSALGGTTIARPDSQLWALSNAGDDTSVVLNSLGDQGMAGIESSEGDDSLGLFEWSAPDGCELDDRAAWVAANPGPGHTITEATLASKLAQTPPQVFRTEHLCQRVIALDTAVDTGAWQECADPDGTMDTVRDRIALCLDVGRHSTCSPGPTHRFGGRARPDLGDVVIERTHPGADAPTRVRGADGDR